MFERRSVLQKGPLEYLEVKSPGAKATVVMFHGYGADAYDLSGLASELGRSPLNWVFPQGPLAVPIGPGWMGRAWFSIDVSMIGREDLDYSEHSVQRMGAAPQQALKLLKALQLSGADLILGGFSQGSMLAMELALSLPEPPRGLIILSGTLFDEARLREHGARLKGLRYFQSHGADDSILPVAAAWRLNKVLQDLDWDGHMAEFPGGHEIPRGVMMELDSFIRSVTRE